MLSRLLDLFRGKPVLIQGTGQLSDGNAKCVQLGDPLAGSGVELVLARSGGELFALDRVCPHEGGRISDGPLLEGKYVMCPLHNYRFDPGTGEPIGVSCKRARTFKLRETGGDCEIWI